MNAEKTTPKTQAAVKVAGSDVFVRATEGVLFGFKEERDKPSSDLVWGVMPQTHDVETCSEYLLELIESGCSAFVAYHQPESAAWPNELQSHRFLKGALQNASSLSELLGIISNPPKACANWSGRYVEACWLQSRLDGFTHGNKEDIVNGFLAPARLLLTSKDPELDYSPQTEVWEKLWGKFKREALEEGKEGAMKTQLGSELQVASETVSNWLESGSLENLANVASDIERVMLLLTQIRALADKKDYDKETSAGTAGAEPIGEESAAYRVLVVDDHAANWRPVFEQLQKKLSGEPDSLDVRFEFSLDLENLCCAAGSFSPLAFNRFDLVVLDVFLGKSFGTDTLKILRRDFSQLPVLLWTTSRDEEITKEAILSNGILLKKTVDWGQLEDSIRRWAHQGKALRITTLPNPFFNHAIREGANRKLAVELHEWCLKQLDSFHALDNDFFRYFTDHGGRHIVKLLELMEHALQGFLGDKQDNLLLPANPKNRELEILALYLTVVCHELGMFPMRVGKQVEDFAVLPPEYLRDVRSLHAVRGMVMIADNNAVHWNDGRGRQLGDRLHSKDFSGMTYRLSALVGYHARVFKSLAGEAFLQWEGKPENGNSPATDLRERIGRQESTSAGLQRGDGPYQDAFLKISGSIPVGEGRERLRRQCALFRFVDALDVSYTRNPAEFLSAGGKLPIPQYRENLKREVCESAGIEGGRVTVSLRVKAPLLETVRAIMSYPDDNKFKDEKLNKKFDTAKGLLERCGSRLVENPWLLEDRSEWTSNDISSDSSSVLQKPLDKWLELAWEVLLDGKVSSAFLLHLKTVGVLDQNAQDPHLTVEGAEILASVTALSVAGELLDEYRAITDTGLQEKIKLSGSGWKWGPGIWAADENLDAFPTLKSVYPSEQYP